MMKNNKKRIGLIVVLVVLLVALIAGFTYSKYYSTVSLPGTATVASWSFTGDMNNGTTTITDLADTITSGETVDGTLVPGTEGSFNIVVDGTGSQVGINYTIAISEAKTSPTNLKFSCEDVDGSYSNLADLVAAIGNASSTTAEDGTLEGSLSGSLEAGNSKTYTVTWEWPYETEDGDTTDTEDAGSTYAFTVAITGEQAK